MNDPRSASGSKLAGQQAVPKGNTVASKANFPKRSTFANQQLAKRFKILHQAGASNQQSAAAQAQASNHGLKKEEAIGVLLRTGSVHGAGIRDPLWAVSLTARGLVRGVGLLGPGGLLLDRGAFWFLEISCRRTPPRPGWRLQVVPMVGRWEP